jgi:hypothetical protein
MQQQIVKLSFPRHTARVGALAWNDHCVYSGSRDRFILQNDTRSCKQERKLAGHSKHRKPLRVTT